MPIVESGTKAAKARPKPLLQRKSIDRPDARETLNMRIRPEVRSLIDHAAELTGKTRTDFVLDAARQAAQNAVLDQTVLTLNAKSYTAFVSLLNAPPKPNENLRRSLQTPAAWD